MILFSEGQVLLRSFFLAQPLIDERQQEMNGGLLLNGDALLLFQLSKQGNGLSFASSVHLEDAEYQFMLELMA